MRVKADLTQLCQIVQSPADAQVGGIRGALVEVLLRDGAGRYQGLAALQRQGQHPGTKPRPLAGRPKSSFLRINCSKNSLPSTGQSSLLRQ